MENRFKIYDGNPEMDPNERALIFTKSALKSLKTERGKAAGYLNEKIALFDELNASLTIFDRITDIYYGFELNGADANLLKMCEKRLRLSLKCARAGNVPLY